MLVHASELARTAGLTIVPTRIGFFNWVREPIRHPDTPRVPPDDAPAHA
jgi:hypothetical protein